MTSPLQTLTFKKRKVQFIPVSAIKSQRGSRVGGWSALRPGRFTPGKDPVPIVYETGRAPGPVWTGAENLAPTGIRSPDRPARSESLYRLLYPGPRMDCKKKTMYRRINSTKDRCPVGQNLKYKTISFKMSTKCIHSDVLWFLLYVP